MKKFTIIVCVLILLLILFFCFSKIGYDYSKKKNNEIKTEEKNQEPTLQPIKDRTYKVQKYTVLDISDVNKLENVKLSMAAINGITLKPGEEFSFNNIVGERTAERGYKEATVIYINGKGEPYKGLGLGGGICQTSSTLYMACREVNLEILERHTHSMEVDYCSVDEEAMINWGTSDLRFKNNLAEDIIIKMYLSPVENNTSQLKVVCEIW
ncbi:MAG: hypothetical protein E7311_05285 [Clostridiales bacterium]|nr:hypothetical protein [Clostridiales bacterium]